MPNGTKTKPTKPYVGFPLFAHGNGQWANPHILPVSATASQVLPWLRSVSVLAGYEASNDKQENRDG